MRLVDSHCHLNYAGLADREAEVLANARARGVAGFLNISTRQSEWDDVLGAAERNEDVWATIGVHPHEADAHPDLGTAALENPQWCAKVVAQHGEQVAVGLDVKIVDGDHRLRGRGWETDGGDLWTVLERLDREGCSRFVVTDVTKDGTLNGPNLELLSKVTERTDAPVIASGGVSSLDDLRAIATLTDHGVEGAIVGKALYAERFTLPEALAAVER